MKTLFLSLVTSALTLTNINIASANYIPAEDVSVTDIFSINQETVIDNILFDEMSYHTETGNWFTESLWWSGTAGKITLDLGNPFIIQDMLIQVDYNDMYHIDYSLDELNWSNLFTITPEDGEVSWGMDTMSSDSLHSEYIANMDFDTIEARYLRVSASGGRDHIYRLSELQAFGSPSTQYLGPPALQNLNISPVPEPSTLVLFGTGLMMLMGLQYRRKKQETTV